MAEESYLIVSNVEPTAIRLCTNGKEILEISVAGKVTLNGRVIGEDAEIFAQLKRFVSGDAGGRGDGLREAAGYLLERSSDMGPMDGSLVRTLANEIARLAS